MLLFALALMRIFPNSGLEDFVFLSPESNVYCDDGFKLILATCDCGLSELSLRIFDPFEC